MINIFTKKYFLADALSGLVDMHNHLLPGIDDGAQNTSQSISLIKGMEALGINDFICTPHIMDNYYPNTPKTIQQAHSLLSSALKDAGMEGVKLRFAAEHMIDGNFEKLLAEDQIMPMETQYILIEMSYLQPSLNLLEAIERLKEKKIYPILAHPERYTYLHGKVKKIQSYKKGGMLLQMNLLSLSDYYGKEVQKMASLLLEANCIDFVATDLHNERQLSALKELKLPQKNIDGIRALVEKTAYNFA